jgi:hypothetical protein
VHAVEAGLLEPEQVSELDAVLAGDASGRESDVVVGSPEPDVPAVQE